jgi:hypothetical protein
VPIRRADESKNYEAAIPQLNKLPELLKHWSATKEQSRTLYLLAYRIFSGAHRQCVPPPPRDILCWLGLFDLHALWRWRPAKRSHQNNLDMK